MSQSQTTINVAKIGYELCFGCVNRTGWINSSPLSEVLVMEMSPRLSTYDIAIAQIKPDPSQPRQRFDPEGINALAESIRKFGLLNPVSVRPVGNEFVILFGERRWLAAKRAKRDTVRCLVWDGSLSESEILQRQLVEDEHRKALDPMELALAHERLLTQRGCTRRDLAQSLQISESDMTRSLALLTLPQEVQESVANGTLPASTAYEISRLSTEAAQTQLARRAINEGLTRDRVTLIVQQSLMTQEAVRSGFTKEQITTALNSPTMSASAGAPNSNFASQTSAKTSPKSERRKGGYQQLPPVKVTFGPPLNESRLDQPIAVHIMAARELTPAQKVEVLRLAYEQMRAEAGLKG